MISEKLLREVLGDIQDFAYLKDGVNYCLIGDYDRWHVIDNCNLAHKCKEWAKDNKSYVISSFMGNDNLCHASINILESFLDFTADTEQEAIFKACERILNEI